MRGPHVYRGHLVEEIAVLDVRIGDQIMCWLSDAKATVKVTGIEFRERDLRVHGLGRDAVVSFTHSGGPWWVDEAFTRFSADGIAYVMARPRLSDGSALSVGQTVKVQDGYGWSVMTRSGPERRDMGGVVTEVLSFSPWLTDTGWLLRPEVKWGCLSVAIDPEFLHTVG